MSPRVCRTRFCAEDFAPASEEWKERGMGRFRRFERVMKVWGTLGRLRRRRAAMDWLC